MNFNVSHKETPLIIEPEFCNVHFILHQLLHLALHLGEKNKWKIDDGKIGGKKPPCNGLQCNIISSHFKHNSLYFVIIQTK
jgi:hypothetical protein